MMSDAQNEKHRILVVEDDPDIPELLGIHLGDLGFDLIHAEDGRLGLDAALDEDFDLVILDLMLPGMDGLEVCRRLRTERPALPILMLTAKTEEMDRVLGLEMGADDYVTKPFSIRELVARVKSVLRRVDSIRDHVSSAGDEGMLEYQGLRIDPLMRQASRDGVPVDLTAREFDLLHFLARSPGRPYTRQELLDYVWGYQFGGYEHTVNSHINRLRGKIEPDPSRPRFIRTVWGVGYRFTSKEELAS